MQNLNMKDCKHLIKEEDILIIQNHLNCELPEDYRSFLLKYNGGYPKEDTFPVIEELAPGEVFCGIDRFLEINSNTVNDFRIVNSTLKNRIPKELICIARAVCGDKICLCVKGKNYGKVYFWDHNWEAEEGEEPTYDNVYLIANSFEDFINSLYEYKEEDEQKR